ncbi:hypothetical protein SVAN01_05429 [Stagonosporopsis vannaccii]|nr:hypothetical protein SVAN01_05429 [Stagonosporopsis vannaccii]
MSPSANFLQRPAYSKLLLALVLISPLGAIAQNVDHTTSIAEADPGSSQTSVAPPPGLISETAISPPDEQSTAPPMSTAAPPDLEIENSIRPPRTFSSAAPPDEETEAAIRPSKISTVPDGPPEVTAPPYPTTPKRDDINPGKQEESTTSTPGVAPPMDPEKVPALKPDPSESTPVIASTAPPGGQIKESSVGGTKPTPAIVAPQSTPGATGAPQASQAKASDEPSQASGASQAVPVPVPGQNTQDTPVGSGKPAASATPSGGDVASGTASGGAVATGTDGAGSGAAPTDSTAPTGGTATTGDDNVSPSATSSGPAQFSGFASRNAISSSYGGLLGFIGLIFAVF